MPLNSHERAFFMEGIAAYMLEKNLPNQISTQQLDEAMRLLIAAIPDSVSQQADAVSGETRKLLRERFELHLPNKLAEAIDYIKTDVRTCGLLVPDISRSDSFKFGHKSFMEFLAGKVFAQWCLRKELEKTETEIANALVNKLGLTMRDVTRQPEVMDFAAQWIAEKSKNHDEAARLLFTLQFRTHNVFRKLRGQLLKRALQCLPYLPSISVFDWLGHKNFSRWFNIAAFIAVLLTALTALTAVAVAVAAVFIGLAAESSADYHIAFKLGAFCTIVGFNLALSIAKDDSYSASFLFPTLALTFLLILEYSEQETAKLLFLITQFLSLSLLQCFLLTILMLSSDRLTTPIWEEFQKWLTICQAAHLDRHALVNVIGEKALCLLENKQQRSMA